MLRTSLCVITLFCLLLAGCGSSPEFIAVSGIVTLDGKMMSDCMMVFQPVAAEDAIVGTSVALSNGKFSLAKSNGLVEGEYGVVFTEIQPDLEDYEAARRSGTEDALNKKFIPSKYTRSNDLRVKVVSGMQSISLELRSL